MENSLSIAFIGGGNMAAALASGLAGKVCPADRIHVIDVNPAAHEAWRARGMSVAGAGDATLAGCRVWIYAVKPQQMRDAVAATRQWLQSGTLVISVAAGLRADTLAGWLGEPGAPWQRLVRCMPNTPALVGAGVTGLAALPAVTADDRALAEQLLRSVGEVVWVADDAALDAVTALSGSGPAYVFLFLEAMIAGGLAVGLDEAQARQLALGTFAGATRLAAQSDDPPAVLRERVTSKGGTTAAALDVFGQAGFQDIVRRAMEAAARRSRELAQEFGA
ncbi:pyrroline-5-carboxylate reductase [Bordetella sp. 2513F-2]